MKSKIVLYNPRAVFYTMPLALVAVGSALDRTRYEVVIVDARLERDPLGRLMEELRDALCLGVTVLTGDPIVDALATTRAVKERFPHLPAVWGGWHPSLFPWECLQEPSVDAVVRAQGEETFPEVVERLREGASLEGVPGCGYKRDGKPVLNPERPFRNLNAFPRHDYSLIPVERYFQLKGERQLDYISSQGCPHRCAFCADPFVFKRRWAGLSGARVAAELIELAERYGVEEVAFQDELFFVNAKRVAEIAEALLAAGSRVRWTATLRADEGCRMDEEVLLLAKRSGCRRVMVGAESGSQRMLEYMKKDLKLEQVVETAERCRRIGLGMIFPFIVGFPDEPEESVTATIQLVKRLRKMSPRFETAIFFYQPYPGSPIFDEMRAKGFALPMSVQDWATFDIIGSHGSWVTEEKRRLVEAFKFYSRFAYRPTRSPVRWPLHALARWRCEKDFYRFPIEKALVERVRPPRKLS
jgi:radical SAM superfamily enzyme YgiQ (UPF0313 family)